MREVIVLCILATSSQYLLLVLGPYRFCLLMSPSFPSDFKHIMRSAGLEETQAGIKIARRNINNLRYADDSTLTAENEEELKSLVMKVRGE